EMNLQRHSPALLINEKRFLLNNYRKDLHIFQNKTITIRQERLQKNLAVLESLNPLSVLQRGYSITRSMKSGGVIRDAAQLCPEEEINVRLARGNFQARIEKIFQE
ncbi:MAG TPA: exodeoxyribonuclease VII large subunit, partial [Smithellaceae bacterium]|nr:exodeoxyribonuclease VII large subunit [Smithellaceae bacterium]